MTMDDLIGIPFMRGGRDPMIGLDCFGLALEVYRRLGYVLPDPACAEYGEEITRYSFEGWEPVQRGDRTDWDSVLMRWRGRSHIALLRPDGRYLHAVESSGVVATRMPSEATVLGWYRPRRTTLMADAPSHTRPDLVEIRSIDVVTGAARSTWCRHTGETVASYLRPEDEPDGCTRYVLSGRVVEVWAVPAPGDQILVIHTPGFGAGLFALLGASQGGALLAAGGGLTALGTAVAIAGNLAVSFALSAIGSLLVAPPSVSLSSDGAGSPTYDLRGAQNSYREGVIPIVYGEHVTGGKIIQVFYRVDSQGRSVLHLLLLLSHGEIESVSGLSDVDELEGDSIPETITINGNPARSYSGVRASVRVGTTDQLPIPGFRDTVTAVPYEVTLNAVPQPTFPVYDPSLYQPFTHRTTGSIDAFEVILRFPEGLTFIDTSGNSQPRAVDWLVRWRALGTETWQDSGTITTVRSSRAAFSVQHRQDGLALDRYDIEIIRQGPGWPEPTITRLSRSVLVGVNEIVSDDLAYPNCALLGLRAIASDQLSGQVPTVLARVRGKKVWTWDGVSETSPSYTFGWSDDPAWIAHDILTSRYYGLGTHYRSCDMVLSSFAEASTFFATMVSDGRGGTLKRGSANIVFDAPTRGWDAALAVLAPFRGGLVSVGRMVRCRVEQAGSPSQLFTHGNIIEGTLSVTYRGRAESHNIVQVTYQNEETGYEASTTQRADDASLNAGDDPYILQVTYRAVTHPSRAARAAKFLLNIEGAGLWVVTFEAGVDAVAVSVGDIISVQHSAVRWGDGGRLLAYTHATPSVTLDSDVTLVGSSNAIAVRTDGTGSDALQEVPIASGAGTYPRGTPITLSSGFIGSDQPSAGVIYAIGVQTTFRRSYRVTELEITQEATARITAVEYDPTMHDDDPGAVETATDSLPDPRSHAPAPEVAATGRHTLTYDGGVCPVIDVSWESGAEPYTDCDIYIRRVEDLYA